MRISEKMEALRTEYSVLNAFAFSCTDEEYDSAEERISENIKKRDAIFDAWYAETHFREIKFRNEFFKGFVSSFGDCKDRKITQKQVDVFTKYLPVFETRYNSTIGGHAFISSIAYACIYAGRAYKVSDHGNGGHITVWGRSLRRERGLKQYL